jgi:hypothetical protein
VNRIHRKQMTAEQIVFTEALVHNMSEWNFAVDHVMQRMLEKKVTKDAAVNTLKYGEVIEVNDNGRVVMRLMKGMRAGTVVVVSIRDRVLVTAWYNSPKDNHKTLNLSEYTWKLDVITYLKGLAKDE